MTREDHHFGTLPLNLPVVGLHLGVYHLEGVVSLRLRQIKTPTDRPTFASILKKFTSNLSKLKPDSSVGLPQIPTQAEGIH